MVNEEGELDKIQDKIMAIVFGISSFPIPFVTLLVTFERNSFASLEAFFTAGLLRTFSAPFVTPERNTCHPSPIMARITITTIINVNRPIRYHQPPVGLSEQHKQF